MKEIKRITCYTPPPEKRAHGRPVEQDSDMINDYLEEGWEIIEHMCMVNNTDNSINELILMFYPGDGDDSNEEETDPELGDLFDLPSSFTT